jgi:hypothetical protein
MRCSTGGSGGAGIRISAPRWARISLPPAASSARSRRMVTSLVPKRRAPAQFRDGDFFVLVQGIQNPLLPFFFE